MCKISICKTVVVLQWLGIGIFLTLFNYFFLLQSIGGHELFKKQNDPKKKTVDIQIKNFYK